MEVWRSLPGWLVLLGALSLGALAGWLGGYLLMLAARGPLRRLHFPPRAASRLFLPLALLVGTVVAGLLLRAVQPDRFQGALQAPLVVPLLLCWLALIAIDLMWEKVGRRHARVQPGLATALLLVRRIGKALVVGVGLAFLLDRLGVPLGGFFLATGAIGAALGFAARAPMENLFGFLTLLLDPPFVVGDEVRLVEVRGGPETTGRVQRIGLQATLIQARDRTLVTLPNALLTGRMRVENLTARDRRRLRISLPFPEDLPARDLGRLCERLEQSLATLAGRDPRRAPQVWTSARSGEARLELEVWLRSRKREARRAAEHQAFFALREELGRSRSSGQADGPGAGVEADRPS